MVTRAKRHARRRKPHHGRFFAVGKGLSGPGTAGLSCRLSRLPCRQTILIGSRGSKRLAATYMDDDACVLLMPSVLWRRLR